MRNQGKMPKKQLRRQAPDIYVLHREPFTGRDHFIVAWQAQHRLTSGYSEEHAALHQYVLVVGHPDGLNLPAECKVGYLHSGDFAHLYVGQTDPLTFFGEHVP
jgi:hypothetical protein